LIEREGDEPLSADDEGVKDAMRGLPAAVEGWTREKMRQLAGLLPDSRRVDVSDVRYCDDLTGDAIDAPPPFLEEPDEEPDVHLLNLATSVFTCLGSTISSVRAGRCLIGWDGAGPHLRCGALQTHWDRRLHFSRRGYEAASALVELVGWDAGTATVVEMDGFDGRFVCGGCSASEGEGEGGRKALTWRECVRSSSLLFSSFKFGKGGTDRNTGTALHGKRIRARNALPPLLEPLNERSKGGCGEKGRVRSVYQRQVVDVCALFGTLFGAGGEEGGD